MTIYDIFCPVPFLPSPFGFHWLFRFRRMSETPTTTYFSKCIAIHLQSVLQYAPPTCIAGAFGGTELSGKRNYFSAPPICIAVRLPFLSQYASHLYRSAFGKILVVVVTGMFPKNWLSWLESAKNRQKSKLASKKTLLFQHYHHFLY